MSSIGRRNPEANRILFVKNLSYTVTSQELYDLFGKFGSIRQIRLGNAPGTKGTAFVVYDDVQDAKMACDKLSGFNFQNRYLVVLYHQPEKVTATPTHQINGLSNDIIPKSEMGATPRRQI
ncbi:RNA-binding domain-containing protein [Lipomyces japonicus]|uniref:RNA-binding domain-containing protein n=1 Tax=Lipomyces japonicus TaxID=56871 RepID=UPI0034CE0147